MVERLKKSKSGEEAILNFCYKLTLLLQDMDHNQRVPFDLLVGPLFEFCCNLIKKAAARSNFPEKLNVEETVENILVSSSNLSYLLLWSVFRSRKCVREIVQKK